MSILATAVRRAIELILPASCVGCGASGTYLCDRCLAHADLPDAMAGAPHGALDSLANAFAYEDVPRVAVHRLKYAGLRAIAPSMALPMARALSPRLQVDAVVPVPLHASKLRERGFNQALLLARGVGEAVGAPVRADALERTTNAGAQAAAASRIERYENVRDAFTVRRGASVAGLRLLLVDDVVTTGATLESAARALKSAGAAKVHGLTFAQGSLRGPATDQPEAARR